MTRFAPSSRNRRTVAKPIPEQPPVITAVRPSSRGPVMSCVLLVVVVTVVVSVLSDEDVLLLGERVGRVRSELPAETGLLVAAERGPVADRGVRVDRQVAGLDAPGHAQRPPDVAGEDRAG